ncbi:hypothetical protein ACVRWK_07050 [Streptococcus ruminantium]
MSLKDEQYKWLAEQAYWVDFKKQNKDYTPELDEEYPISPENESLGFYKVLKVEDNPTNGMQAMVATMMEVRL